MQIVWSVATVPAVTVITVTTVVEVAEQPTSSVTVKAYVPEAERVTFGIDGF